jgi:aminoglycoside 6'-N-acetyltransferase I
VHYLEQIARDHGILTLYLATDDDLGATSLFGADLFGDLQLRLRDIALRKRHPMAFYRKLGWSVVGVIPGVNRRSRPHILMAKPVRV